MKAVKAALETSNPDRVAAFEAGAQAFAKKVVANMKNYEFVSSSSKVFRFSMMKSFTVHERKYEP
jgi:hypothetical protein